MQVKINNPIYGVPFNLFECTNIKILDGVGRYSILEHLKNPKGTFGTSINGKPKYFRVLIRLK